MREIFVMRNEKETDIKAISDITVAAFANNPHGNQTEQYIVNALRASNALTVSLVAEAEGRVVGHVAFSPVTIDAKSCDWYGLGPVSVSPDHQKQGIGKALVNEGLDLLRARGAKGCVLVGDPDYYEQFGFRNFPELFLEGVPPENFLALSLGEDRPQGVAVFHEAFSATQ